MPDYNDMPEPPPIDYDWMPPPPDEPYFMPADPFPDDWFSEPPLADRYEPDSEPWLPDDARLLALQPPDLPPPSQDGLQGLEAAEPGDEGWGWQDARFIGVVRETEGGTQYEIGALDVYANIHSGDLGASYLPIATLAEQAAADALYHELQAQVNEQGLAPYQLPGFAEEQAFALNAEPENWRSAIPEEYAAYDYVRGLEMGGTGGQDTPPEAALEPLFEQALALGEVTPASVAATGPDLEEQAAFQALTAIGIEAEHFDPTKDPPPFYDAETGTAYWIGVFQPDKEDRENCVTSILSLGRNPETGELEAQLAPCVPGDWDKAFASAEYLIQVAQKGGIEQVFDTAEGMALATDQRELWEKERGIALETDAARDLADYTREAWEVDL